MPNNTLPNAKLIIIIQLIFIPKNLDSTGIFNLSRMGDQTKLNEYGTAIKENNPIKDLSTPTSVIQ
jgi:hypothetical protein